MATVDPTSPAGKLVSFIFGLVFGVLLALGIASLHPVLWQPVPFWTLFASCAIGCGLMAALWGDEFWRFGD